MFCNARQMAAQYNKKRELTEAGALSFIYREFSMLNKSKETNIVDEIRSHITAERYRESVSTSCALLVLILFINFETVHWKLIYDIKDFYVSKQYKIIVKILLRLLKVKYCLLDICRTLKGKFLCMP